tara:strand:- start:212 stop:727 length:516 start_codon:yes stop_codon:yes gene_type:complete
MSRGMNRSDLRMNRRGQFPLILLVVITLTLVLIALFSFASFSNELGRPSKAFADVMFEVDFAELYVVEKASLTVENTVNCDNCVETDLKKKFMEVADKHDLKYLSAGNFFGKIRNGEFNFSIVGGEYVLEINDLFVKSEKGRNEIVRDFDLTMRFDSLGELKEKEKVYKKI